MKRDLTLQIFSGGFEGQSASFEQVRDKLEAALPLIPASRVIMGWSVHPEVYQKTARYLSDRGIEFYLWLPVFSETGLTETCAPIVGHTGKAAQSYHLSEGENFTFYCPHHPQNVRAALNVFRRHFASHGFDGVFLDKIRYPSFVNGLDGGLSCFCPHCLDTYEREGLDIDALKKRIRRLAAVDTPFGATAYQDSVYTFGDELWTQFFALKSRLVFDSLGVICAELRNMGYRIGMDVFAPFISAFVGQDIPKLSALCDFVKPMMYRATHAPAGLPFELEALLRETGVSKDGRHAFSALLGLDPESDPFDPAFAARDLDALVRSCACSVYAGLEFNRKPGIAEVDPAYIRETLSAYSGSAGFVFSWDLLDAPMENIRAVGEWICSD